MIQTHKLDFLIATYIFCILVSELLGGKTFPIMTIGTFTLNASVAIFAFPLIFAINDIIAEVYGKKRAQSVMRLGLLIICFLLIFTYIATLLPPSTRFLTSEQAYDSIFGLSIRMSFASLGAFFVADTLDILIYSKIREKFGKKALWMRTNISNFVAQLFDTTLFMLLAFYTLEISFEENMTFLISLIIPYWLTKCVVSIIETPLVYAGVSWLKKGENNDR